MTDHIHAPDSDQTPDTEAENPEEGKTSEPPKAAPSWILSHSGQALTREELLARYRRQRALPDDPFEHTGKPVPPPGYRDRIMKEPRPAARFMPREDVAHSPPPPPAHRSFSLPQTLAIAAGAALIAGGGAGFLGAHFAARPAVQAQASLAPSISVADAEATPSLPQLQPAAAAEPPTTVVEKKPVATATLDVEDAAGVTNSYIPLALHAEPAGLNEDMLLKISGIPEGAYLTNGHREGDQIWSLSLADLKDVKLVVPKASQPQLDLAVAAFEPKTGELAAPVKTMTVALKDVVVQPTSAPPPGQVQRSAAKSALPGPSSVSSALPVAIPPPQDVKLALASPIEPEAVQRLLTDADTLFQRGDIAAARRGYEQAWGTNGASAAAYGLARTFDPVVLASLSSRNAQPDRGQALAWYQRAASAGNVDAAEAIVRLQLKP